MTLRDFLIKVHNTLDQASIDHALIGGLALSTLGINRATFDVDLLVSGEQKELLCRTLKVIGLELYFQTKEVLHFKGIGRLDILLANRPLSKEMLNRAQVFPQHGLKCVKAEDLIGLKIQAYVNDKKRAFQDKADIQNLIEKHQSIDWNKIKQYAEIFGEWNTLQEIRKTAKR